MEILEKLDQAGEDVIRSLENLKNHINSEADFYNRWETKNIYNADGLIEKRNCLYSYYNEVVKKLEEYQYIKNSIQRSASTESTRKSEIIGQAEDNIRSWYKDLPSRADLIQELPWLHDDILIDLNYENPDQFGRTSLLHLGLQIKDGKVERTDGLRKQYEKGSFDFKFRKLHEEKMKQWDESSLKIKGLEFPLILDVEKPYKTAMEIGKMLDEAKLIHHRDIEKVAKLLSGQETAGYVLWLGKEEAEFLNLMKNIIKPFSHKKGKNTPWADIKKKFKKRKPGTKIQPEEFSKKLKSTNGSFTSVLFDIQSLLKSQ